MDLEHANVWKDKKGLLGRSFPSQVSVNVCIEHWLKNAVKLAVYTVASIFVSSHHHIITFGYVSYCLHFILSLPFYKGQFLLM
jgi:hypothetical protein